VIGGAGQGGVEQGLELIEFFGCFTHQCTISTAGPSSASYGGQTKTAPQSHITSPNSTRHHLAVVDTLHRLMSPYTALTESDRWSQRDTLATGHGHCRDNRRQHTSEVERIMRSLAGAGCACTASASRSPACVAMPACL
jgi:hypothetical protein